MMKPRFWTLVGMIAMAAMARIMPHPWNVTPIAAMALFGGAQFRSRAAAFGVPLLAMFIGDAVVGFHPLMPLVYACFAVTVVIGFWLKTNFSWERVVMGSLAASVLFFMATNFGMWAIGSTLTVPVFAFCISTSHVYSRSLEVLRGLTVRRDKPALGFRVTGKEFSGVPVPERIRRRWVRHLSG